MASATVDQNCAASISAVHPDIIRTQILTRLDGPTLASASCTSSELRTLCTDEKLWRDICTAAWPSTDEPVCRHVISTFPAGVRSFFADSHPFVEPRSPAEKDEPSITTTELISAVDLYYRGNLIYTKVQETKTVTGWFMCSPFRVDLLEPKESVPTRIQTPGPGRDYDAWTNHLEENLILNWILIDPSRKRAANVSSRIPVSARRNWLTGELQIRYATIVAGPLQEKAEVAVVVTCTVGEEEELGGEVQVRDVMLQVEDIEGKSMSGRDSMVILQGVMKGRRGKTGEARRRYEEFVEKKRRFREMKEKTERAQDMACIAFAVALFLAFWSFILFR